VITYKYQVNQQITFRQDRFKHDIPYDGTVCQCSHVDGSIYYQIVYDYGTIAWIPESAVIKAEPMPEAEQIINKIEDIN